MLIAFLLLHLGSTFMPVAILTVLALADARDAAQLDDLRTLAIERA
jgi:hypothetical protein